MMIKIQNSLKGLLFIFMGLFIFTFVSAIPVLLSNQGTDLRLVSTGALLETGNLTILIYGSSSGGSAIFSQTFANSIINGSWNVVINPDLEFGKSYWKDYEVNGDNLNFSGDDRIEFQSPLGLMNNATLFNFSLIETCAVGSSIRHVYENGSVVCEIDNSGGNSSWNETYANTLYADISVVDTDTQKSGSGYLYNDSTTIYLNETELNETIDLRSSGGDNSSWNESYADTKYLNLSGGNANQDINISPYNFEAGNLTLSKKITFALGEAFDNMVDGWIRITGGLNITGDVEIAGNITTEEIHLEQDSVNHRIYDNSSCVIIEGDTSTMYIC